MPVFRLGHDLIFPPPHLATEEGLLAVGGDLSSDRLMLAYKNGIFPWYSDGDPILWWSPDPRLVLYPHSIRISRSLKKILRQKKYKVTMNTGFRQVISACAKVPRRGAPGTWITEEMRKAYTQLHDMGYAHSVETWYQGKLVGGLYGVSFGRCFFGESMFSTMSDASKVALVHLEHFLSKHRFDLIDCQLPTDHLISMGAVEVDRILFLEQLAASLEKPLNPSIWKGKANHVLSDVRFA